MSPHITLPCHQSLDTNIVALLKRTDGAQQGGGGAAGRLLTAPTGGRSRSTTASSATPPMSVCGLLMRTSVVLVLLAGWVLGGLYLMQHWHRTGLLPAEPPPSAADSAALQPSLRYGGFQ